MKARTLILILVAGLILQGCVSASCDPVDPPDLSGTERGVNRSEVEAFLGEPITMRGTEYGRVSVYRYLQETCGGAVFPVPFILILPLYWDDGALLTVEYTPEDTVISAQMWPDTENSDEAIEHYEARAARRQDCRAPFPVAARRDKATQIDRATSCRKFGLSTAWQWVCLAAHHGDRAAQRQIATYYRLGAAPIDQNIPEAYGWLLRAAGADGPADDWRLDALRLRMTPTEIAEAERRAFAWRPDPQECKPSFDQLESAEVLPPTWTKDWDDCHWPHSAAAGLTPEDQLQRAESCTDFGNQMVWRWTCLAAHGGNREAQYDVGGYYRSGLAPIETDIVKAHKWYNFSARNGSEVHAAARDFSAKKMTSSQLVEAERLVAEWQPNPTECELDEQAEN